MPIHSRVVVCAVALGGSAVVLIACGGGSSQPPLGLRHQTVPANQRGLSSRLVAADRGLRVAVRRWRTGEGPRMGTPPHDVAVRARYVQRAIQLLARRRRLAAATIRRLPSRFAREIGELIAARTDLRRLSAGWPARRLRTGPPDPIGGLLDDYRAAQRRFGIRWQVLAAVNFVESAFGRVRSQSVAGAQGPMQFMPATWRAYGLGGNARDPHDAILGAANLLHHAGAPGSYSRALSAYNPSRLYVDAVRRYSRLIERDRKALYLLYSWRP
jgi:Transglycosylase SLT domain